MRKGEGRGRNGGYDEEILSLLHMGYAMLQCVCVCVAEGPSEGYGTIHSQKGVGVGYTLANRAIREATSQALSQARALKDANVYANTELKAF